MQEREVGNVIVYAIPEWRDTKLRFQKKRHDLVAVALISTWPRSSCRR
jgi:hypothetical protein